MAYQHILVASDLTEETRPLLDHAGHIAKAFNAKLSLIYVDMNYADFYAGLGVVMQSTEPDAVQSNIQSLLAEYAASSHYPITETIVCRGDLSHELQEMIATYQIDLLVFGHHQDFWSKIISSARQIINSMDIDMLMVPFFKSKE